MLRLLFAIVMIASSLNATDDIGASFSDFVFFDKEVVKKIASKTIKDKWHNIERQSFHIFNWLLGFDSKVERIIEDLGRRPFMNYGPPDNFIQLITDKQPKSFPFKPKVFRREKLSDRDFFTEVQANIHKGVPIIVYYREGEKLALATVVGYREKGDAQDLVVAIGGSLEKRKLNAFFRLMNLTSVLSRIEDFARSPFLTSKDLRSVSDDFLDQLQPYTLIRFEERR